MSLSPVPLRRLTPSRSTDFTAYFDPAAPNFGKHPKASSKSSSRSIYGFHKLTEVGTEVRLPMTGNKIGHSLSKSVASAYRRWSPRHEPSLHISLAYDWAAMELVITRTR